MTAQEYRLQNATALTWNIDGVEYPVAGVSGATIAINQNIVELFTGDSVNRENKYREERTVQGEITVRKWDHDIIDQALMGTDGLEDEADVPDAELEGTFDSAATDRTVTIKLVGGSTEEWPIFDLDLGDYGEWTLDMTFDDMETFDVEDPA